MKCGLMDLKLVEMRFTLSVVLLCKLIFVDDFQLGWEIVRRENVWARQLTRKQSV